MNKRLRGHLWRIVHPVVAIRGELARWRLRATPPRPSPPYREHFAAGYTEADVEAMRGSWHVSAPGSHLIDEAPDPAGATMPSPKMLREAANILETAPYRRMKTAAWLRYVAGQVEELDREEAAEGLDDRALADTTLAYHEAQWAGRCREVGPAGYLCTEPLPHETVHRSTAPNARVRRVGDRRLALARQRTGRRPVRGDQRGPPLRVLARTRPRRRSHRPRDARPRGR